MGVIWNQLARPINSENWIAYNSENMSVTFDSGIATCEWLVQKRFYHTALRTLNPTVFPIGDKYYCSYMINPSVSGLNWGMDAGNVAKYGAATNVPSNTWTQVSIVVINARATANYYYINYCDSSAESIPIGMIAQNKCPIFINLTQMFGVGKEPTKAQFEAMCALNHIDLTSALPYDEGTEIDWIDSVPSAYELRRRIILNEPHLITPAAAPLQNFVTDLRAPLKECKVSFLPVQEGSGDPSPDNVRPISGWTGFNLVRCGKNLLDKSNPLYNLYNMEIWYGTDSNRQIDYSRYLPAGTYCYNITNIPSAVELRIGIEGSSAQIVYNSNRKVFTLGKGSYYYAYAHWNASLLADIREGNLQINVGSNPLIYEPYNGTTFPVDWTNDAGEIFGGYVDLAKGELVEEWTAKHVKDWNWYVYSQWGIWYVSPSTRSSNSRDISDKLVSFQGYDWNSAPLDSIISGNNSSMFIKHTGATSNTEFNNWLAEVDPIVVYKRATPITYTLSPIQIKTLLGTNNIYANTNGDVQVTYWKH